MPKFFSGYVFLTVMTVYLNLGSTSYRKLATPKERISLFSSIRRRVSCWKDMARETYR